MQAILVADYSFTPLEYWRGVSRAARDFIKKCLTVEPTKRMTSHGALSHPWIVDTGDKGGEDLLPTVKQNFNARRTLHAAIDTIRAINQLRAGQAMGTMDGALSKDPARQGNTQAQTHVQTQSTQGGEADGGDPMDIDGRGNARGQTEEMIRAQERRVKDTMASLWGHR